LILEVESEPCNQLRKLRQLRYFQGRAGLSAYQAGKGSDGKTSKKEAKENRGPEQPPATDRVFSVLRACRRDEYGGWKRHTTDANEVMAPVHHRMPVVLGTNDYDQWLDPSATDLTKLLTPCPAAELICYRVDPYVNNARNQGPQCIEPANSL
jgi:hypothetical protein